MALIKCPECGKENVSDSAVSCPECGFAIKKYVIEKHWKEQNEEEQARIKKKTKSKMSVYLILLLVCLLTAIPLMYFSVINRGASVYMVGLASSKIGKEYECRNCKHKW